MIERGYSNEQGIPPIVLVINKMVKNKTSSTRRTSEQRTAIREDDVQIRPNNEGEIPPPVAVVLIIMFFLSCS